MNIEPRPTWWDRAGCNGLPTAWWFPDLGVGARKARSICNTCPVQAICLQAALDRHEQHGVWGGVNFGRRRRRVARDVLEALT